MVLCFSRKAVLTTRRKQPEIPTSPLATPRVHIHEDDMFEKAKDAHSVRYKDLDDNIHRTPSPFHDSVHHSAHNPNEDEFENKESGASELVGDIGREIYESKEGTIRQKEKCMNNEDSMDSNRTQASGSNTKAKCEENEEEYSLSNIDLEHNKEYVEDVERMVDRTILHRKYPEVAPEDIIHQQGSLSNIARQVTKRFSNAYENISNEVSRSVDAFQDTNIGSNLQRITSSTYENLHPIEQCLMDLIHDTIEMGSNIFPCMGGNQEQDEYEGGAYNKSPISMVVQTPSGPYIRCIPENLIGEALRMGFISEQDVEAQRAVYNPNNASVRA